MNRLRHAALLSLLLWNTLPGLLRADCGQPDLRVALELDLQADPALHPGQNPHTTGVRTRLGLACQQDWSDQNGAEVDLEGRFDTLSGRAHHLIREMRLWWRPQEALELNLGYNRLPQGYLEAERPNDLHDPKAWWDGPFQSESMGRLSLAAAWSSPEWVLRLDLMPGRQYDLWEDDRGRFRRTPFFIDRIRFANGTALSTQLRLDHYGEAVEFSLMAWHGLSPQSVILPEGDRPPFRWEEYHDRITQIGASLLLPWNDSAFKLELYRRARAHFPDLFTVAGGLEHHLYQLGETELTLLAEAYHIEMLGRDHPNINPPTAFDHDLYLGARLRLNDSWDQVLQAGWYRDWHTHSRMARLRLQGQPAAHWAYEAGWEWFDPDPADAMAAGFANDSRFYLRVTWYPG